MRWPEALTLLEMVWASMPERYRFDHQTKRYEHSFVNYDCSQEGFEGIRAQDILPLLLERFHPEAFVAFGNLIDVFVDRGFGPNFDVKKPDDREFIDRVALLDDVAIDLGMVKPTHLIASFRGRETSTRYWHHWAPDYCVRRPER
jgi:hypothetical protein